MLPKLAVRYPVFLGGPDHSTVIKGNLLDTEITADKVVVLTDQRGVPLWEAVVLAAQPLLAKDITTDMLVGCTDPDMKDGTGVREALGVRPGDIVTILTFRITKRSTK